MLFYYLILAAIALNPPHLLKSSVNFIKLGLPSLSSETSLLVRNATTDEFSFLATLPATQTEYTLTSVYPGMKYFFKLIDSSSHSTAVSFVAAALPSWKSAKLWVMNSGSNDRYTLNPWNVNLKWNHDEINNGGSRLRGYRLYYAKFPGSSFNTAELATMEFSLLADLYNYPSIMEFFLPQLKPNTKYAFKLFAWNSVGPTAEPLLAYYATPRLPTDDLSFVKNIGNSIFTVSDWPSTEISIRSGSSETITIQAVNGRTQLAETTSLSRKFLAYVSDYCEMVSSRTFCVPKNASNRTPQSFLTTPVFSTDLSDGTYTIPIRADGLGDGYSLIVEAVQPGLTAEFFDNQKLEGEPVWVQKIQTLNFTWPVNQPVFGTTKEFYSLRISGYLKIPYFGNYTFFCEVSSHCRVSLSTTTAIGSAISPPGSVWSFNDHLTLRGLPADSVFGLEILVFDSQSSKLSSRKAKFYWSNESELLKQIVDSSHLFAAAPIQGSPIKVNLIEGLFAYAFVQYISATNVYEIKDSDTVTLSADSTAEIRVFPLDVNSRGLTQNLANHAVSIAFSNSTTYNCTLIKLYYSCLIHMTAGSFSMTTTSTDDGLTFKIIHQATANFN